MSIQKQLTIFALKSICHQKSTCESAYKCMDGLILLHCPITNDDGMQMTQNQVIEKIGKNGVVKCGLREVAYICNLSDVN